MHFPTFCLCFHILGINDNRVSCVVKQINNEMMYNVDYFQILEAKSSLQIKLKITYDFDRSSWAGCIQQFIMKTTMTIITFSYSYEEMSLWWIVVGNYKISSVSPEIYHTESDRNHEARNMKGIGTVDKGVLIYWKLFGIFRRCTDPT